MSVLLTWSLGAGLMVGLVLVWLGRRGRRVDDHPVCARCERDLYGLSPLPQRCPECGGVLVAHRIRRGNRVRRGRLVVTGTTLALPGALVGTIALALGLTGTTANELKPVWLLRWEAEGWAPAGALAELAQRAKEKKLSAQDSSTLIARYLAQQGDRARQWQPAKGDFLESCQVYGAAGPPGWWDVYLQQGIGPAVDARPVISRGRQLPVRVMASRLRLGTASAPITGTGAFGGTGGMQVRLVAYAQPESGEPYAIGATMIVAMTINPAADRSYSLELTGASSALAYAGASEVPLRLAIDSGFGAPPPLNTRAWDLPVRLVARAEQSARLLDEPQIARSAREAIAACTVEIEIPPWWHVANLSDLQDRYNPPTTLDARVRISFAPRLPLPPASYAVYIDDGRREYVAGSFLSRGEGGDFILRHRLEGFEFQSVQHVRLIFRPCTITAETTLDVFEICGEEFVLEEMPVQYPAWYEALRRGDPHWDLIRPEG